MKAKLSKETMAFQREQLKAGGQAAKIAYKEQKSLRREERGELREERFAMQMRDSADRQTAMMLQAIQSLGAGQQRPQMSGSIPSIPSLLR